MSSNTDIVEVEIRIAASVQRVWKILTDGAFLGSWFGNGSPASVDLRPGGLILFDHGVRGALPARIERVDPPRHLSYRWSQGEAGTEPTDGNATLVEFSLEKDGAGTVFRVTESGFDSLDELSAAAVRERHSANLENWPAKLQYLRAGVEQSAV